MYPDLGLERFEMAKLAPRISAFAAKHAELQRLWMPSEVILRDYAPREIPHDVAMILALNLLTEEGLPHFPRLLTFHLGDDVVWRSWIDLWTAEEKRHGMVIQKYLDRLPFVDSVAFERALYNYLEKGFHPEWQMSLYQIIAYVVMQERATQISHRNVALRIGEWDPVAKRMLDLIAGEEAKHFAFYRRVLLEVFANDPDGVVVALERVMYNFTMPGANIPGYGKLTYLAGRTGVFGPREFSTIVTEVIKDFELATITGLCDEAKLSRDHIVALPSELSHRSERLLNGPKRQIKCPFLPGLVAIA